MLFTLVFLLIADFRQTQILQGLEKLHRRYSHFTQRQLWNALFDKFSKDFQVRDPLFLNFQERCFTYKHLEDLEKDLMAYSFPKSDGAIPPLDGGKSNQGGVSPNLPQTFTLDQVQKFSAELRSRANVSFQLPRQDHGAEANRRRSRNTSTDVPSSIPQFNHPTAFHTMAKSSELLEPRLAALESAIQQNVSKEKVMQLLEIRSKDLVKFTRDLVGSLKSRYDKTKEIYKEAASKQESLEKKMIELERNYQFCDQGLTKKLNAIEAASDAQIQTLTQTVRTTGDESLKTAKKSMEFLKERTDAFGEKIQRLERSIGQVQTDTKQPNTVSNEQIELLKKEVRDLECEQTQQQLDVIETVKMELQNQEQSLRESQNAAIQAKVQELVREKLSVFEQHISSMEQRLMSKQGERAAAAETKLRDNLQSSLELRMDSFEEISTKAQKQHIEIEAKEHVQRIEQQIEVKHRNIEEALSKKVDTKLQQQLHSNADEIERHRQTSQHAQKRLEDTLNTKFEDLKQANVQQRDKEKATSTKARLDLEKRQDNLDAYVKHALADSHAEFITAIESMRKDLKTQQDRISDFQEQIIRKDEEIATLKHAFGDDHLGFEAVWEMQVHKEQVDAASSPSLQNKPILAISGKKSTKGPTDEQTSRIGKVAQRIYKLPKSIRSSEKLEAEKPSQGSFVVQPAHPKARKSAALLADSEEDEALPRMSPAKKRASEGPNSEPAAKRTETARANNNSQVVNRIVTPQMLPPMESLGSSGRHGFQPSAASEKESTKLGREHKTAKTNNDSQVVDDDELLINDCIIVDFREISADEAIPPVSKPITPVSEAIIPASEAIDKNSKITKQPAKKGRKPKRTR